MSSLLSTGCAEILLELIKKGLVNRDEAITYAQNKASFRQQ